MESKLDSPAKRSTAFSSESPVSPKIVIDDEETENGNTGGVVDILDKQHNSSTSPRSIEDRSSSRSSNNIMSSALAAANGLPPDFNMAAAFAAAAGMTPGVNSGQSISPSSAAAAAAALTFGNFLHRPEFNPMMPHPFMQHPGMPFQLHQGVNRFHLEIAAYLQGGGHPQLSYPLQIEDDGVVDKPEAELDEKHLWDSFSECVNEMIITKSGR